MRVCISHEFPGDAHTACPHTWVGAARVCLIAKISEEHLMPGQLWSHVSGFKSEHLHFQGLGTHKTLNFSGSAFFS
jgi:hypothetical protein